MWSMLFKNVRRPVTTKILPVILRSFKKIFEKLDRLFDHLKKFDFWFPVWFQVVSFNFRSFSSCI